MWGWDLDCKRHQGERKEESRLHWISAQTARASFTNLCVTIVFKTTYVEMFRTQHPWSFFHLCEMRRWKVFQRLCSCGAVRADLICSNSVMWSSQSLCHEELRQLWREKVVHAGSSLIKPGECMLVCQEMRREPRGTTAIWFRTKYTVGQDAAHDRHPHSCPQTGALNYARKSKMWNKWCSKMWSDVNNNVLRYPVFLNIFIHQVFW